MTQKTIGIEGMSCGHCVSWVTEALEKIDGVTQAKVSLEAQNAEVDYDESQVSDEAMVSAIESAGYSVKSI